MSDHETMSSAERTGDRKTILLTLRRILAETLDVAEPQQVSALAGRLAEVTRELENMGGAENNDSLRTYTEEW